MTHADFVEAWRGGRVEVHADPAAAAVFLSSRLLLPFVAVAIIGVGIGLVLWGALWSGISVGALGIVGPRLIKRGARGFLLSQIASDSKLFDSAVRAGALRVVAVAPK
jgi:hypothetical protein